MAVYCDWVLLLVDSVSRRYTTTQYVVEEFQNMSRTFPRRSVPLLDKYMVLSYEDLQYAKNKWTPEEIATVRNLYINT